MEMFKEWLKKAHNDLLSAIKLVKGDDPIWDTSIYHTQQCAEKSLKGYLAYQEASIEKIHDLRVLIEKCIKYDKDFDIFFEHAEILTPYVGVFRYPDDFIEPDKEDVIEAIKMAKEIFEFVQKKISG